MNVDADNGVDSPDRDQHSDYEGDSQDEGKMATVVTIEHKVKTESNSSVAGTPNGKSGDKDPSRPRRKKARRACHACQRAHLTCGDERPCARCIKRGLAEQCQDGVRKKAKYLHDAPPEALIPPQLGGRFNMGGKVPVSTTVTIGGTTLGGPSTYYQTAQTAGMDLYSPSAQIGHGIPSAPSSFTATPISPQFHTPQGSQMQTSHSHVQQPQTTAYAFDPSDPALFNLDIGNFNFVNQYGALEFSMLNQITSNVNDGPDAMTPINQVPNPYNTMAFPGQQQPDGSLLFPQDHMMNPDLYSTTRQSGSVPPQVTPHNTPIIQTVDRNDISNGPYAYAIAARPNSLASASPDPVDHTGVGESASSPALFATEGYAAQRDHQPVQPLHKRSSESRRSDQAISRKRQRVSDEVYDAIKEPYSYTEGFHRLMAYLKKYYRRDNTARIAQALAAVRPALLTFAQDISERDLLQMEITVQRTLVAYDDFLRSTGTPTIAIRRDGTIMCVNEEFCLMTGWKKKVLLGRLPNRNVNRGVGGSSSLGTNTAASSGRGTRRGSAEPEFIKGTNGLPNTTASNGPIHNVLVTEIMDQDTVVQFYEDYAKLAFANPMGVGMRRGKCVKYRTPDDQMRMQNPPSPSRAGSRRNSRAAAEDVKPILEQEEGIASESALKSLGEPEGTVDVMYCWWVKRDMFEVPQLIVMNFLPVLPIDYTLA